MARMSRLVASEVDRALSGGLPATDVPLSLAVMPFGMVGKPGAALAIVAGVGGVDVPGGSVVELLAVAFDETWKEVARTAGRFMLPAGQRQSWDVAARGSLFRGSFSRRVLETPPCPTMSRLSSRRIQRRSGFSGTAILLRSLPACIKAAGSRWMPSGFPPQSSMRAIGRYSLHTPRSHPERSSTGAQTTGCSCRSNACQPENIS